MRAGHQACGVVIDPARIVDAPEADGNYLLVATVPAGGPAVYSAGSAWDRSGHMADLAAWDRYLDDQARRRAAPVEARLSAAGTTGR
jgi:hypothetical protein